MILFSFALRHLLRHWRLNLAVLLGLTLAATLLAGLPGFATAIAADSLEQALEDAAPMRRNLFLSGRNMRGLSLPFFHEVQNATGDLVEERMVVRQVRYALNVSEEQVQTLTKAGGLAPNDVRLWAFSDLEDHVVVLEGRLPGAPAGDGHGGLNVPPQEIALGVEAAEETGLAVGDTLLIRGNYRINSVLLTVVGIVEPRNPRAEIWVGDLAPFDIAFAARSPTAYGTVLSAFMDFNAIEALGPVEAWRLILDRERITVETAPPLKEAIGRLQTQLSARRAELSTGLVEIIDDYQTDLQVARTTLFLLSAQALLFVFYMVWVLTRLLVERSRAELATLVGRGAGRLQITLIFAFEGALLAFIGAVLLGPPLANAMLRAWGAVKGGTLPPGISAESWRLALLAATFGWLTLVASVFVASRRSVVQWQSREARATDGAAWQGAYLDFFFLALGAVVYWQLHRSGSFLSRHLGGSSLADPVLLLGPSLLLVAVAMSFLRFFPLLLRFLSWAVKPTRGLVLPLGLTRLARSAAGPSRIILLISLALGLSLFANAFGHSLFVRQEEMAHYLSGADIRVDLDELRFEEVAALPGVEVAAHVIRTTALTPDNRAHFLLVVDPETFARVTRYPANFTSLTIPGILEGLDPERCEQSGSVPAIVSYEAIPPNFDFGGLINLRLAGRYAKFEIRGKLVNFPTMSGPYLITTFDALEKGLQVGNLDGPAFRRSHEAWLSVDEAQYEALIAHPLVQDRVIADATASLRSLRSDALAQGASGAFRLNAFTLALLSIVGFFLINFIAVQQRGYELGILRAGGMSARQLLSLLSVEGALVVGLGFLAGTTIGYGLVRVMLPFLSPVLKSALAGGALTRVLFDWPALARLYGVLLLCYALALGVMLTLVLRLGLHRTLRIGEE
jgi:putative ABC transport system permease protein